MSDEGTPPEGGKTGADGAGEFKPITSQDDFERALGKRLERERAKFADYDAVKAKATEFDKAAEASKTEQQKLLDRATTAEAKVAKFEARDQVATWAAEVVKGSTIPASALRGNTEDEIKAHFEQLKVIAAPATTTTRRTSTPPGKSDKDTGGGRAAAALRQLRQGT